MSRTDEHKRTQAVIDFMNTISSNKKANALKLFKKLDDEQKLMCVNPENINNSLCKAIMNGFSLELIKKLTLITDPKLLFAYTHADDTMLKKALTYHSKVKEKTQIEIVEFLLDHLLSNQINFNFEEHIRFATFYSTDAVIALFLEKYKHRLTQQMIPGLLDGICKNRFMPKSLDLLIKLGGRLSEKHKTIFTYGFKYKKYAPSKKELLKIVKYFSEQNIEIPLQNTYFYKKDVIVGKETLVKHIIKNCTQEYWQEFEDMLEKLQYCNIINLDLIQDCFNLNPHKRISNPEKLATLAFSAIKGRHLLIHTLLERGMNLNQVINFKDGISIKEFSLTLAHFAAFFSTDAALLQMLRNISTRNVFLMTPSHYAALSMPFERFLLQKRGRHQISPPPSNLDPRIPNRNYHNLNNTLVSSDIFNFNLIGPNETQEYGNLSQDWDKPDLFGFTPLMYGASSTNPTKNVQMLNAFKRILLPMITDILLQLPTALIPIIGDYVASAYNPTQLMIIWGARLIFQSGNFQSFFHELLIEPIKKHFDTNRNFLHTPRAISDIRNAMYLFTQISLMEGSSYGLFTENMVTQFNFKKNQPQKEPAVNSQVIVGTPIILKLVNGKITIEMNAQALQQALNRHTLSLAGNAELELDSESETESESSNKKLKPSNTSDLLDFASMFPPQPFNSSSSSSSSMSSSSSSSSSFSSTNNFSIFRNLSSGDSLFPELTSFSQPLICPAGAELGVDLDFDMELEEEEEEEEIKREVIEIESEDEVELKSNEPKKSKKRPRSERFFQESSSSHSWKEDRDLLVEKLHECCVSGSRPKIELRNALQPFIKTLNDAADQEAFNQCKESMNDRLDMPGALKNAVDKYDLRQYIENMLGATQAKTLSLN